MPSDFTVIQAVRNRFGEGPGFPFEKQAPKVGVSKSYRFSCSNVDPRQMAILQFETIGVWKGLLDQSRDILQINGVDIPGSITPGGSFTTWRTHSLVVPANVLKEQNTLYIEAISYAPSGPFYAPDQFIVDNIIVHYKTRTSPVGSGMADLNAPRAGRSKTKPKTRSKTKRATGVEAVRRMR